MALTPPPFSFPLPSVSPPPPPTTHKHTQVLFTCLLVTPRWPYVGDQEHNSPPGTKQHFNVNYSRKNLLFWSPTLPPCQVVANQEYSLPVNSNQKRCRKHNRTQRGLFTLWILNGTLNHIHTDSVVILCVLAGPQLVAHGFAARILKYCTCSRFSSKRETVHSLWCLFTMTVLLVAFFV